MSLSRESIASQDPVREISWNQDLILMGADTGRDERIVLVHNIVQTNSFEAVNLSLISMKYIVTLSFYLSWSPDTLYLIS